MGDNPIVLCHGICPFDRLYLKPFGRLVRSDRLSYFKGIKSFLEGKGYKIFSPWVSWGGSLERRAMDLFYEIKGFSDDFCKFKKLNFVAHSMGGLDVRYMIYRFDLYEKVEHVITIGTPHHGTSLADIRILRFKRLIDLCLKIGLDLRGFFDLTTSRMRELNQVLGREEKRRDLKLWTIAGLQSYNNIFFLLRGSYRVLEALEGENDGLVSVRSAVYDEGYFYRYWDLDHLNQIGWWDPSEEMGREEFYEYVKGLYLEAIGDIVG